MTETSQTHRFDADTLLRRDGESHWSAEVQPGWLAIGGSPNGGYLLSLALRAAGEALPGSEPLSATAHYVRPGVVGPAEIDVEVVKQGRVKSVASVRLTQEGTERVRVLATLSGAHAMSGPSSFTIEAPPLAAPDDCAKPSPMVAAVASIAKQFDYRTSPTSRWVRGATGDVALLQAWIRFADGRDPDVASLPLFVDAFPPAIYEVVEMAAVPTLELTVHVRQAPAPGWLQARARTRALLRGVVEEDVELWDSTGQLVAMSRQLALVQTGG